MFPANPSASRLSDASKGFLEYARVVLGFAPESIVKYSDCLRQIEKATAINNWNEFSKDDLFKLRLHMANKSHSASRQTSILAALKRMLKYLADERDILPKFDLDQVRPVAGPRKAVIYLKPEEVGRLVTCIRLLTHRGQPSLANYRLRALIEVLLGTGMRIGEALSLKKSEIDVRARTASIVGKGGKQRVVFFTERALSWLQRYLDLRTDDDPHVFTTLRGGKAWARTDIWRYFARLKLAAGIGKPIRPHILRHTAATQLLFEGCPIGHIKEILGHDRLETTCRYYLGLDHRAAQLAHAKYLHY